VIRPGRDDGLLAPLRDPAVRRLAVARFAALLGSSILPTALAFAVLALEGTTASSLGFVVAAAVAGQVLFLIPGGVVADRYPRKGVMVVAEVLAGAAPLVSGALYLTGHATVGLLALFAAVGGVASGFFYPAVTGFVPEVASPDSLQEVNALLRLSVNVARIVGTAAAGVFVAVLGPGWAIAASGVLGIGAAALLARVEPRFAVPPSPESNPFADFRDGWGHFVARRWVVAIVVLGAVSNFGVSASLGVLGPLRVNGSGGAASWAVITTALAAGTVVGAVVAVRLRPARPLALAVVVLAGFSLPIGALALSAPLAATAAAAFLAGVSVDVFSVLWDTALQQHVPREALSRVSAFDWLGSFGLAPVALVVAGPLVDSFGLSTVLWCAALLAATPPLALLEPEVRRLRRLPARPV
jgi:MFS family permease